MPPTGLDQALFSLCARAGDWNRILALASTSVYDGAYIYKAAALTEKGLADAARVVYDDAIRKGTKKDAPWRHVARYAKAELLVGTGDIAAARRELARLYADCPNWQDYRGLTERLRQTAPRSSREPIPEDVRHAVWRRDQGRCVKCGSQENLEFDHIISFSRGGSNTERNLQLLCESCNRRKGATVLTINRNHREPTMTLTVEEPTLPLVELVLGLQRPR